MEVNLSKQRGYSVSKRLVKLTRFQSEAFNFIKKTLQHRCFSVNLKKFKKQLFHKFYRKTQAGISLAIGQQFYTKRDSDTVVFL